MKSQCTSERPEATSAHSAGDNMHCLNCGYALRGIAITGVCPECGTSITSSTRLARSLSHQATGVRLLAWSFMSVYGLLCPWCVPAIFLLVATSGTVLRVAAILKFRRAQLHQLPRLSSRLAWMSVLAAIEFVLLACLALYAAQTNWTFVVGSPTATLAGVLPQVILVWAWLLAMSAFVLLAVMLVAAHAKRLEHEVVLLQLRSMTGCIIAGIVLGAIGPCVALWAFGWNSGLVMLGLFLHGFLVMIAAGHGITAVSKLANTIRAEA